MRSLEIINLQMICKKISFKYLILPNFLVCKFCGKAQYPHRFPRNYAETAPFHKISTQGK